ncbi:MAG: hypothetical protein ACYDCL_05765 [Myxococcales bacterium]
MPRSNDGGDRPRRSWRDIDKTRDKSSHTRTSSDRDRERFERTTAYSRYKQNLEKVFSGGELSDAMRERLDPGGQGKARDAALKKAREAESPKAFAEAVDALLDKYALPDDPYLLDRILDHPKAQVVKLALEQLEALASDGKLQKPPASLRQRLASLELTSDDPAVQEQAQALAKKLR